MGGKKKIKGGHMTLELIGFKPVARRQRQEKPADMRMYERCGGRIGHRRWDGIRLKPWYKRIIISLCDFISAHYHSIYINPVVGWEGKSC
jgi:hypothetical protein